MRTAEGGLWGAGMVVEGVGWGCGGQVVGEGRTVMDDDSS